MLAAIVLAASLGQSVSSAEETNHGTPEQVQFFEKEVLPILQSQCFACHGGEKKIQGGLRLTSRDAVLQGGESGPAVSLEKPTESILVQAINYDSLEMPPKGKLPKAQIDTLTKWVSSGLPYSNKAGATSKQGPPKVDDEARKFWSYRPVMRPAVPMVRNAAWVKSPIDAFVLAKLDAAGLQPNPPASKTTVLRRVYFDLIGLPPSPQQVAAFVADESPQALEKVVDELLASRHYGERWARHWLDLVRYAETNSFERDGEKPNVWRYRDYVIQAFNSDKPYDVFIREQLAGDELDEVTTEGIIATGFYRLGLWDDEPADPQLAYMDELDDIVATVGQTFLGMTVNCGRCHDHKIDPFPQRDYYRLLSFFHGIERYSPGSQRPIGTPEEVERDREKKSEFGKQLASLKDQLKAIEKEVAPKLAGGEVDDFKHESNKIPILKKNTPKLLPQETLDKYLSLKKQVRELERNRPKSDASALCVIERKPPETFVLHRGSPRAPGDKVTPGFPSVVTDKAPRDVDWLPEIKSSGRRRVVADWIANPENQMTTRVIANRIWQFHFGRGIVRSTSDFGYRGTPPTHPELLEWLASEFVESGWKFKAFHKRLILSNTYQMSSGDNSVALKQDPENDLFWRFNLRRLEAEEVRDSILAVSGNLNLQKTSGPSVFPTIPREVLAGQSVPGNGWRQSSAEDKASRSVFIHIKRSLAVPIIAAFDGADTDATCPVRFTTTQPTQALGLLNSQFLQDQSRVFANQVAILAKDDLKGQVRTALERAIQRPATLAEVERGVAFVNRLRDEQKQTPEQSLASFCLLLLNLNEFVFVD